MPELTTKAFGTITIEKDQILEFPEGIFGFNDHLQFALIEEGEDNPFKWLQSTSDKEIAFIVIQPELFINDYAPEILSGDLELVQAGSLEDCTVLVIVTIPEKQPEKMTANLQGPILINRTTKQGRQSISNNIKHLVRVPILEQLDG